jgi:queuine tRNA-ribosyltransferase
MLASYHNLYFLHELVLNARKAIREGRFLSFKKEFLARFEEEPGIFKTYGEKT